MAFDFPNAPSEGLIHTPSGGPTYKFTDGLWNVQPSPDLTVNGDLTVIDTLRLPSANEIDSIADTDHPFQIGASNTYNVAFDDCELQARNNNVASTFYLNFYGGDVSTGGDLKPRVTGINLGSATQRWGTVYTSDLSLKNEIGDWTIVEGEDDLFLYNNKKGKTYKFTLTEVDPSTVPPKKV
jgi:hypothetical protein